MAVVRYAVFVSVVKFRSFCSEFKALRTRTCPIHFKAGRAERQNRMPLGTLGMYEVNLAL